MKKKYLLIYLNTGGGHYAPAKAIADYMIKHLPEMAEPVLIDGLENSSRFVKFILEDGYRILQAKAKWLFEFLYGSNKIPLIGKMTSRSVSMFIKFQLRKVILAEKPDAIINLHFFTIDPIVKVLKKNNLDTPFYSLVTDPYSAHPIWFYHKNQNYIIFSEELAKQVRENHPENKIYSFPFVVNEKFSTRLDLLQIKKIKDEMELPEDKKIILVLGGSDGIPKGEKILKRLLKRNIDAAIIMICGKNKTLLENANEIKSIYPDACLKIFGFVNNVYELINISDAVITKCGASTIMQILVLGKIPFVNSFIWEQEKGNVDFLKDKDIGIFEPKVKKMVKKLQKFLTDESIRHSYEENLDNLNMKNGLEEVVQFITK